MGFLSNLFGFNPLQIISDMFLTGFSQYGARQEYLADREHTEQREDSAYQRAVEDMQKAGLNPFTIGTSGASSSPSRVGENMINNKIQTLGYILDLKNLDAKNRKITNEALGDILGAFKGK